MTLQINIESHKNIKKAQEPQAFFHIVVPPYSAEQEHTYRSFIAEVGDQSELATNVIP